MTPEGQQEPLTRDEKRLILGRVPRQSRRTRFQTFSLPTAALGPVLLAVAGAAALACGAVLLSIESSLSALTTREEMRFLEALGVYYAGLLEDDDSGQ